MASLFPSGSATAYQRYAQELSNAIKYRDWIYDPDYALANDAAVYEKIMRDPVTAHAIRYRKHLVAGAEWRIEPASDDDADKRAAEIVEEAVKKIENFTDARIRLASSIFLGSSYAAIQGERYLKRLAGSGARLWWCPKALIDKDRRRFRRVYDRALARRRWEMWSVDREQWEPLAHPEWFVRSVYDDTEASLSYGRGLLNTVYQYQAAKSRTLQDASAASERFGQGFLKAAVDNMRGPDGRPTAGQDGSGSNVATAWARELNKHRARNILVHDARDKVELLTGFTDGWKLLESLRDYYDTAITTAILGANIPTSANAGGSYALALIQENSTEALVQADRLRLSDEITRDLVGAFWRYNRLQLEEEGLGKARKPVFRIVNQKREDPAAASQVIAALLGAGVELRADEVYRKCGFTQPLPEDAVIKPSAEAQEPGGLESLFRPAPPEEKREPAEEALNGAQIAALQQIVQSVSSNLLPPQAAIELIMAGFPSMDRAKASKMITSADNFDPQPIEKQARVNGYARQH